MFLLKVVAAVTSQVTFSQGSIWEGQRTPGATEPAPCHLTLQSGGRAFPQSHQTECFLYSMGQNQDTGGESLKKREGERTVLLLSPWAEESPTYRIRR